jgi:GNAT superfamily N-acetyltransferase
VEGVRPAVADDLPRLTELCRQLFAETSAQRGGATWALHQVLPDPIEPWLQTQLERSDGAVLVGTIDDAVIGFAIAWVEPLSDGSEQVHLPYLFVEPEARGVGVGAAIMEAVLTWGRERGCVGIDSAALPGARATKNFFESFGLVAREIAVYRSLET